MSRSIYAIISNARTSYYQTENFGSLIGLLSLLEEVHTAKERVPSLLGSNAERLVLYSKERFPFCPSGYYRLFQPLEPGLYLEQLQQFSEQSTEEHQFILDYDSNCLSVKMWLGTRLINLCGLLDDIISAYSGALRNKNTRYPYLNKNAFAAELERICEVITLKSEQDNEQMSGMNLQL
ncbi:hypothetical protein [Lacrimispora sp.]|uniref:hypothetical protein n=1 Tax=Lacrimispora sp. TaxID=2719234 RepID=UPI0028B1166B|nr:hypothetical protein [Lacrimispora sp.]